MSIKRIDAASFDRQGLRDLEPLEQLAARVAEQVRDGAGLAVSEQGRVHALLEPRAPPHHAQTKARPLGPRAGVRQPDRRHQIAPAELCQDRGVDPVGLEASGASPLTRSASAISTSQPSGSS
jgi:hypothetical protein